MLRYMCLQIEHEAEQLLCLTYFYEDLWNVKCFLYCSDLLCWIQLIAMTPSVLSGLFQRVFLHHFKTKFYSMCPSGGCGEVKENNRTYMR